MRKCNIVYIHISTEIAIFTHPILLAPQKKSVITLFRKHPNSYTLTFSFQHTPTQSIIYKSIRISEDSTRRRGQQAVETSSWAAFLFGGGWIFWEFCFVINPIRRKKKSCCYFYDLQIQSKALKKIRKSKKETPKSIRSQSKKKNNTVVCPVYPFSRYYNETRNTIRLSHRFEQ